MRGKALEISVLVFFSALALTAAASAESEHVCDYQVNVLYPIWRGYGDSSCIHVPPTKPPAGT